METCRFCHQSGKEISRTIGFCADCIRQHFVRIWPEIQAVHARSRQAYGLTEAPPRDQEGIACGLCVQDCRIPEGGMGYCGLRKVKQGKLTGGDPREGNLTWYHDPLPTNCVSDFVCAGGTGCGYPRYANTHGPEYGYKNLAIFYHACSFNCLFCQNYHFKDLVANPTAISAQTLAGAVDHETACICFFGGDPAPQILHTIQTARLALKNRDQEMLRICWETNGSLDRALLDEIVAIAMDSGGCIKFDLKAWDDRIHQALCGVTNHRTLENFQFLAHLAKQRPVPPLLIAGTPLVPGYVDEREIAAIAEFIAGLNPEIPYNLLVFYPQHYLRDLPATSPDQAHRCKAVAEKAGLRRVHLGNVHWLRSENGHS